MTNSNRAAGSAIAWVLLLAAGAPAQAPLGTTFTYQGLLNQAGKPLSNTADLRFTLWDDAEGGNQVGAMVAINNISVVGGLFTVPLNTAGEFGPAAFNGQARWIEIAVRSPAGQGEFTTLVPRQELTAAPYAHFAAAPWQTGTGNIFYSGGRVGIGTDDPQALLGIVGPNTMPGILAANGHIAIRGSHNVSSGTFPGVWGETDSNSSNATGLRGYVNSTTPGPGSSGVRGVNQGTNSNGYGVHGTHAGGGVGVYGESVSGPAIQGIGAGTGRAGDFQVTNVNSNAPAVHAQTLSPNGSAIVAMHPATSGVASAIYAETASQAFQTSAIQGKATATQGYAYGVRGETATDDGAGVSGRAVSPSGFTYGVYGQSDSTSGRGVVGWASNGSGTTYGGFFQAAAANGIGVYGFHDSGNGTAPAVYGRSDSDDNSATAVHGLINTTAAGSSSAAVRGENLSETAAGIGVYGSQNGGGWGVYGRAIGSGGIGVRGWGASNGFGVYSVGDYGGSGGKYFHIDHPLDPANKYLNHHCAEGPEPLLIYRGNVTLDGTGQARVELPEYFEAINRDFHYHLTPIGAAAPGLHVAQEIADNAFRIAGGTPGQKVSWTVTGIRNDPYMQRYRRPAVEEKTAAERGLYQHPELYGQPAELGVNYHTLSSGDEPWRQTRSAAQSAPDGGAE